MYMQITNNIAEIDLDIILKPIKYIEIIVSINCSLNKCENAYL